MTAWSVYVLASEATDATYVGVTTDPERRLAQHNGELPGGAKSTRAGRPWRMARRLGPYESRGEAQRMEYAVKRKRGTDRLRTAPEDAAPA